MNEMNGELGQLDMIHRQPRAAVVQRIPYLRERARDRRVIHIGFADAGCREMQALSGAWLHAHLAETAKELVGIDIDEEGVSVAAAQGYEAYLADCRDPEQVERLGIEPADLVIAGEVIEHLDDPGSFFTGLRGLVAPGGVLVVTTPNAAGLLNVAASLLGYEINHPDHVVMFTWRTLTALMSRHGWVQERVRTYVPEVKELEPRGLKMRLMTLGVRVVVALERLIGRWWAPFVADGLIIEASAREGGREG
ncbi:MAG: Ubiquinone biosynthesis O-methyltransferase [Acidimicrobiales bacterium]|nr:MAG: methyltransferase domain-containing protein [Actinomycetota bacterium]MBV6508262.1 Ubiquinone biosynthesis O-methyltransferase [Acidimicrobiales bacterium]RIK07333.1 MAG: hypothetical protein DCC48_04450 [Acidobacteriota bacterium]